MYEGGKHGPSCEKKHMIGKMIYCNPSGGFNDIIVQLVGVTEYAIKYNYSIILIPSFYKASNFADVFDFTNYPCKIYINSEAEALYKKIGEMNFKLNPDRSASAFNNKIYPPELILVRRGMMGSKNNVPINRIRFFSYIKLKDTFKQLVLEKLAGLPKLYYGIHIRNTDHLSKCTISKVEDYLKSITDSPIVVATDNKDTLNTMCAKFSNIISTGTLDNISSEKYLCLHGSFIDQPDNLKNAILDLLIIANASTVKTTLDFGGYSGFSKLIYDLHCDKNLLAGLISVTKSVTMK